MRDLACSPNDPNYSRGVVVDTPHDLVFENTPELAELVLTKKFENQEGAELEDSARQATNLEEDLHLVGIKLHNKLQLSSYLNEVANKGIPENQPVQK